MTTYFQAPFHPSDLDAVAVPVSFKGGYTLTWLNEADADRLGKRRLHLGSHGYPSLVVDHQDSPVHRWVLDCERGDGKIIDHVNGDKLDNRRANLRIGDAQLNAGNRRALSSTGFRGVGRTPQGRFIARAKLNGDQFYLGTYDTAEEAAEVSHLWRLDHLPGYRDDARLRFTDAATLAA